MSISQKNLEELPYKKFKKNQAAPLNSPLDKSEDKALINSFSKVNPLSPSKLEIQGYFASFFNENKNSLKDSSKGPSDSPFPELTLLDIDSLMVLDSDITDSKNKLNSSEENLIQVGDERERFLEEELKNILECLEQKNTKTAKMQQFFEYFKDRIADYDKLLEAAKGIDNLCIRLNFTKKRFLETSNSYPELKRSSKYLSSNQMSNKAQLFIINNKTLIDKIMGFDLKNAFNKESKLESYTDDLLIAIQKEIAQMPPKDKISFFDNLDSKTGIYGPISSINQKNKLADKLGINSATFYSSFKSKRPTNLNVSAYTQILFPVPRNTTEDLGNKPSEICNRSPI